MLDGPEYRSSKNDMFQPSITHTLSEINEITLRLHFVFYFRFIGLYELLVALPAQLQPHVDSQEDLTFLWDVFGEKSLHSLVKVNHADVRFFFAEKHMEKYFERHPVKQRSNYCPPKTKQPCSISLTGVEVVKKDSTKNT